MFKCEFFPTTIKICELVMIHFSFPGVFCYFLSLLREKDMKETKTMFYFWKKSMYQTFPVDKFPISWNQEYLL